MCRMRYLDIHKICPRGVGQSEKQTNRSRWIQAVLLEIQQFANVYKLRFLQEVRHPISTEKLILIYLTI